MVFSSLIFIFIFLPVFFLLYFVSKDKYKNTVLLLASLFFYSWGEPKYVLLMVFSILINYIFARLIDKYRDKAKIFLVYPVTLNPYVEHIEPTKVAPTVDAIAVILS